MRLLQHAGETAPPVCMCVWIYSRVCICVCAVLCCAALRCALRPGGPSNISHTKILKATSTVAGPGQISGHAKTNLRSHRAVQSQDRAGTSYRVNIIHTHNSKTLTTQKRQDTFYLTALLIYLTGQREATYTRQTQQDWEPYTETGINSAKHRLLFFVH